MINNCMAIYKGFSTIDRVRAPYTLTDQDLIKRDLLNTFYTKKGERVMRPEYGSVIWDLLMNPEDSTTTRQILDDVKRIIDAEPRVQYVNATVYTLDHLIQIDVDLKYLPSNNPDKLYIQYVRNSLEGIN